MGVSAFATPDCNRPARGTKGRRPGEIERDAVLAPVKGALRAPLRGAAHP